tara:strand:- start:1353 stop:2246 length:894 start_codon:yes stop_codon:yes gene_type:complete
MFSNFVYPAQVFIYCTITQVCIYIFMQFFVLAGFYEEIRDAFKNDRFSSFLSYAILLLFSVIIKVVIFIGVITTLYNSGAIDLANILGIVYPVLLAIGIFGLGIYQLYRTYIVDEVDRMDLNTYIQDYTFAGKEYNVNDTDATAIDKKRVQKAYENWMKKSEYGSIYKKNKWNTSTDDTDDKSSKLITDTSFISEFKTKWSISDISDIILPETSLDLKNKYIFIDPNYINLSDESSAAKSARQYYVNLKNEVGIADETYLDEIKARYTTDNTSSYTNMNGISSIQGYSNIDGFTNYN